MASDKASNVREAAVRRLIECFHTGVIDFAGIEALFADEAVYQPQVPVAPPLVGAKAIRMELERQLQLYNECDFKILHMASAGPVVFTERLDQVSQDGVRVTIHVCAVFEFDDTDRIASWREYWDLGSVRRQVGLTEAQMLEIMGAA